jgi:hypothetical protein
MVNISSHHLIYTFYTIYSLHHLNVNINISKDMEFVNINISKDMEFGVFCYLLHQPMVLQMEYLRLGIVIKNL